MPVKRRNAKRRLDPAAEAEAWSGFFETGRDFFRDLPAIGIETSYGRPDPAIAQDAWARLHHLYETPPKWASENMEAGA